MFNVWYTLNIYIYTYIYNKNIFKLYYILFWSFVSLSSSVLSGISSSSSPFESDKHKNKIKNIALMRHKKIKNISLHILNDLYDI